MTREYVAIEAVAFAWGLDASRVEAVAAAGPPRVGEVHIDLNALLGVPAGPPPHRLLRVRARRGALALRATGSVSVRNVEEAAICVLPAIALRGLAARLLVAVTVEDPAAGPPLLIVNLDAL